MRGDRTECVELAQCWSTLVHESPLLVAEEPALQRAIDKRLGQLFAIDQRSPAPAVALRFEKLLAQLVGMSAVFMAMTFIFASCSAR